MIPLHPEIAAELIALQNVDQAMRKKIREGQAPDLIVDEESTKKLKEIIAEIGWPTISKVGEEGSVAAWLLTQHADHDPHFQEQCLSLMEEAREDVDPVNIAYLTDRVRCAKGLPQLYGTQFHTDEAGVFGPQPIEDEAHLDERRAFVGLKPMVQYRKEMEELKRRRK